MSYMLISYENRVPVSFSSVNLLGCCLIAAGVTLYVVNKLNPCFLFIIATKLYSVSYIFCRTCAVEVFKKVHLVRHRHGR